MVTAVAVEHEARLEHRPGLDSLRGVAVLLVLAVHSIYDQPVIDGAGRVGVTMFFVLSGFLITRLLVAEVDRSGRVRLGAFYARRARRLLPALGVVLMLGAFVNWQAGLMVQRPILAALTYTSNYAMVGDDFGSLAHLWSLAVEEHFYLAWPLLVALVPRRWLITGCAVAVPVVLLARMASSSDMAYLSTHLRMDAMLIGGLLAFAPSVRPPRWLVAVSCGVLAAFCHESFKGAFIGWGMTVVALASALLVASAASWEVRIPVLEHVGRISYGLYLYSLPVAFWSARIAGLSETVFVVSTVTGSFLLAEVSYRWVELPVRSRRQCVDPDGGLGDEVGVCHVDADPIHGSRRVQPCSDGERRDFGGAVDVPRRARHDLPAAGRHLRVVQVELEHAES